MLAFFSLTNSALLAGLSLLAIPVIAHLLRRQSQRTIVFPSIAFLVESLASHSKYHRLQRWLLLALRLLAVACIVLAFARPVWNAPVAGGPLADDQGGAVVVLLDVSVSTGQLTDGVQELERLKGDTARVLDELRPGVDLAGLIAVDAAPKSTFQQLSGNLTALRDEAFKQQPRATAADFAAALRKAGELLNNHPGPKRIVLCSDLQRESWFAGPGDGGLADDLPAGTQVVILPRIDPPPGNIALDGPRSFPPRPLPGEAYDLTVRVTNHSDRVAQVPVHCTRSSDEADPVILSQHDVTVSLTPRERREVTFHIPAMSADRELVEFQLTNADALPADNESTLVVETIARTPVIVLSDDDPNAAGTSAYYLSRALSPDLDGVGRFAARSLRSNEVTPESLSGAGVVVTAYLGQLKEEAVNQLVRFVEQGGTLIGFCGDGPVQQNLELLDAAAGDGGLLPWRPGPVRTALSSREPRHISSGRWQSRWLRQFDEQSQLAIEQIRFERTWSTGAVAPQADMLLLYNDRSPALGSRTYGRGTVLLATFSPDATTSDLARHGSFVALVQMLVLAAESQQVTEQRRQVGQAWLIEPTFETAAASRLNGVGPDDQPLAIRQRSTDGKVQVSIPNTSVPGIHQLRLDGQSIAAAAFHIPAAESDLTAIAPEELSRRLAVGENQAVVVTAGSGEDALGLRGEPLWGTFFLMAMVAIAIELLLLGLWRR
ncbi:MAG: BatA domain-containing protein [Planctomycetaceae bacterium]